MCMGMRGPGCVYVHPHTNTIQTSLLCHSSMKATTAVTIQYRDKMPWLAHAAMQGATRGQRGPHHIPHIDTVLRSPEFLGPACPQTLPWLEVSHTQTFRGRYVASANPAHDRFCRMITVCTLHKFQLIVGLPLPAGLFHNVTF